MAYDARHIANWFVTRAQQEGKSMSITSLLNLTYIAHGWHLEMQSEPLFPNRIEAWKYGPVIPDVYNAFRQQGVTVRQPVAAPAVPLSPDDESLLEQVWDIYGDLSAMRLSDMIHVAGGPWAVASQMGGNYARIPDELIRQHYSQMRAKAENAAHG